MKENNKRNVEYRENKKENGVRYLKQLYLKVLEGKVQVTEQKKIIDELVSMQKPDGSWSVIDDYRVDSDIRVEYAYVPTYYATATLIKADTLWSYEVASVEKQALLKGLGFAKGRRLSGHGFTATASLLQAINIYKKAGIYTWMKKNENLSKDFCSIFHDHIRCFRKSVENGCTYSDWNVDFREEFEKEVMDYDNEVNPYVWYAAYGSNINEARFMEYINRCSDKTPPIDDRTYIFPYDIYFATNSGLWERKGVAFLDDTKLGMSWGRVYKITTKQFREIQKMEGLKYSKLVRLGELERLQVLTFTADRVYDLKKEPSIKYLEIIKTGLKEVYPEKTDMVLDLYLYTRGGLFAEDIEVLRYIRNSPHAIRLMDLTEIGKCMTKLKPSLKRLYYYGFIVQDSRSIRVGHDPLGLEAMVYTKKEKRELTDILILTK